MLWQKFDQRRARSENAFHAWALRIAQIEVLSYRKRQRRRGEILTDDLYQLVSEATLATAGSVNARLETLRDCCDKLPDVDQQLLRVRYETDASVAEIACRTGRSADSVYRSFRRIHEWLFECIEDVEQEEGFSSSQREQETMTASDASRKRTPHTDVRSGGTSALARGHRQAARTAGGRSGRAAAVRRFHDDAQQSVLDLGGEGRQGARQDWPQVEGS